MTPYASQTILRILQNMVMAGYLTEEEGAMAQTTRLRFELNDSVLPSDEPGWRMDPEEGLPIEDEGNLRETLTNPMKSGHNS